MLDAALSNSSKVLPLVRYRDPRSAVAWLNEAFGFETRCLVSRVDGSFAYAHLAFGDSLIMVTPAPDVPPDRPVKPADDSDKPSSEGRYFVVKDIEAHLARAKAADAEILSEITDDEHGGRRYACRDPGGHAWTFGTYDPVQAKARAARKRLPRPTAQRLMSHRAALTAAAALTIVLLAIPLWRLQVETQSPAVAPAPEPATHAAAATTEPVRQTQAAAAARASAMRAALEQARDELAEERAARRTAEAAERTALAELSKERVARQDAERSQSISASPASADSAPAGAAAKPETTSTPAAEAVSAAPQEPPQPVTLPSIPVLAEAQAALAKGEIETARQMLRKLAEDGVPEAALALGSTYDPVNVERAGMGSAYADRAQAKQWYRRAIELAAMERRPTR